ncbi:MAG: ABC transporter substrate-binding protein [Eubacteriales bacterium]
MKQPLFALVVLALAVTLVSCSTSYTDLEITTAPEITTPDSTTPDQPEEDGAIVILDHAGREVTLPTTAQRLVSGYTVTTSIFIGLGLEEQLVGIEMKAETRPLYPLAAPHLLEVPGVGTSKEFDIEGTMALAPDLVVLPIRLVESAETFAEMGINAICVNPENDALLAEAVDMIARATGTEDRARDLLTMGTETLAEVAIRIADQSAPRVYFSSESDLLATAGAQMYQSTLIEQIHAENVASTIEETYWANISYEQLIAYNPDYIIIAPAASYGVEDVLSDPNLQSLDCVKENRVVQMPYAVESWDLPMPSSYLGSLWMASVFYPDSYSNQDFLDEVVAYYQEFYDFDVDTTQLQ